MQPIMFLKPIRTVISLLLFVFCIYFLTKMGMQPLWAAIGILIARGMFRLLFQFFIMIVSIVIVIATVILFFAWL
jgi:hypothetical protein